MKSIKKVLFIFVMLTTLNYSWAIPTREKANLFLLNNVEHLIWWPQVTHWQDRPQPVESYREGPARRAEIIFLISLPFSLLLNVATTALVYQAATGNTNLPTTAWLFASSSALLFSGAIAWHDYEQVTLKGNSVNQQLKFRYSLPF